MAVCPYGKKSDDALAVCIYLSFSGQIASCKLIADGFNPFEDGCSFQHDQAYGMFVDMYAKLKMHLSAKCE